MWRRDDLPTEPRGMLGSRVSTIDPEVHAPARGCALRQRRHAPHHVAGHRRPGFAADIAREPPESDRPELLRLPAKYSSVERLRLLHGGCVKSAHRPRTRLVDELRAPPSPGFPA